MNDALNIKINRLIARKKYQTEEELKALLDSFIGQSVDDIEVGPITNEEKAEYIALGIMNKLENENLESMDNLNRMYLDGLDALKLCDTSEIVFEALFRISPYETARSRYLQKAIAIGDKKYGGEYEKQYKGVFYQRSETRPYLRCMMQMMHRLREEKKYAEAIAFGEKIIQRNKADNLGMRSYLQWLYIKTDEYDKFADLIETFPDEYENHLNLALFIFQIEGECEEAKQELEKGLEMNKFILPYLCYKKKMPKNYYPAAFSPKDESGALNYCFIYLDLWRETFGVQGWLKKFL
jgi:hypothetical protein